MSTKTALITGASARIGKTLAIELARDGWDIAIHYHQSKEAAAEVAAEIKDMADVNTGLFQANLEVGADVEALIPAITAELGPLTCLINNASVFEDDSIETLTRDSWDFHLNANLWAPVRLTQMFAQQLPEDDLGNVINILDQRVWKLNPRFLSYTVTKSALWTLTQTLAQGLAPKIRVNGIGPGPTLKNARQSDEDFAKQEAATLLNRGASPEEIASGVRFILASQAMTGQMIALDGGQHLIWDTPDVTGITE